MLEKILGITMGVSIADLGALVALTAIVVEVLKKILPQKFPTQALTIIVSIIITIGTSIVCFGIAPKIICGAAMGGFIVAFVAMNGFDSLKNIWNKFNVANFNDEVIEEDELFEEDDGGES